MKPMVAAMIAGVLALAGLVTLLIVGRGTGGAAPGAEQANAGGLPPEALALMVIPPFALVDQSGAAVGKDIYEGRMTLLAFSFTNCG